MSAEKLNLIGISGHAGSGKDSIAKFIHTFYENAYIEHVADPLKDAASQAFGIARDCFDDTEYKNQVNEYWGVSPRAMAQFMGTEMFRNLAPQLLPEKRWGTFWVDRLHGRLFNLLNRGDEGIYEDGDTVIIPDVRFQDEVDYIIANGGFIITVRRPGYDGAVGISGHASEKISLLNIPTGANYGVNNYSSLPALFESVDSILKNNPYFTLSHK
jgi:hypothetical protein